MMLRLIKDIEKLIDVASRDDRKELGLLLGYGKDELDKEHLTGVNLSKSLWWKYQTPLGYMIMTPAFDDICVDIAKRLKQKDLASQEISCWELLECLLQNMWTTVIKQALPKMSPEDKEKFAKEILTPEQFKEFTGRSGFDWATVTGGALLLAVKRLGGFATYKYTLIIVNQIAKMLVGRGLSLAANAALVRAVSVFLGPVGWLLMIWGVNDLLGTNYKRVIPATFYIYSIYVKLKEEDKLPF